MKLYNSVGPNPRVVRMFMAERGLEIEKEEIDLMGGENRQAQYLTVNPAGTTPALVLDDGSIVSEITVICEYLDDHAGSSALIGTTPSERAETRMWVRRIDLGIAEPLANGFRFSDGLPVFKERMPVFPEAADALKQLAQHKLAWLDGQLEGRQFVCGDRFTLADILLYCFLDFGTQVGQPMNPANNNISAWFSRVSERASVAA